jgi:hypothetical protein
MPPDDDGDWPDELGLELPLLPEPCGIGIDEPPLGLPDWLPLLPELEPDMPLELHPATRAARARQSIRRAGDIGFPAGMVRGQQVYNVHERSRFTFQMVSAARSSKGFGFGYTAVSSTYVDPALPCRGAKSPAARGNGLGSARPLTGGHFRGCRHREQSAPAQAPQAAGAPGETCKIPTPSGSDLAFSGFSPAYRASTG